MRIVFHPVADNPIRMSFVPGWKTISTLIERLDQLIQQMHGETVVPAHWEPFHEKCPSCRNAREYAWARAQLLSPQDFAVALALFPDDDQEPKTPIGRANWLLLCAKGEASHVTHKYLVMEGLELWHTQAADWLRQITATCKALGVETSADFLEQEVQRALSPLEQAIQKEIAATPLATGASEREPGHGFDAALLELEGWSKDPGAIVLPVEGVVHELMRERLLLNLRKVALVKGSSMVRLVDWEKVTLVYVFDGAVTFQINGEPPLVIAGYKHPEETLRVIQDCYKAATERILQAVAAKAQKRIGPSDLG